MLDYNTELCLSVSVCESITELTIVYEKIAVVMHSFCQSLRLQLCLLLIINCI